MALVNRENQLLANGFYYRLNENGEAIICGAEVWPEVLIIPETLDGHTVVEIGDGAFDTDNAVDSVLLTDGPVPVFSVLLVSVFLLCPSAISGDVLSAFPEVCF